MLRMFALQSAHLRIGFGMARKSRRCHRSLNPTVHEKVQEEWASRAQSFALETKQLRFQPQPNQQLPVEP